MRTRATVLLCALALGFVAGRASASDGLRAPVTHIAAPAPRSALRGPEGQIRPITPHPAADVEESVGGTLKLPAAVIGGRASYVAASYGPRYLALPEGPGHRVTICAKSRCVVRVSTDAGPDLAMQRAGRVADLSFADFRYLCRCNPPSVGLLRVTVQDGGGPLPTLPATDTGP